MLLGQQSDDGECYTIGAVVADHLRMPSLTQVIKIDVEDGGAALRCERQAEYGYDTVLVELPAVISVGDAINEPRYPSLKAIMGAKKKPLETLAAGDAGIEPDRVGFDNARARCTDFKAPPGQAAGPDHRGRGHGGDGREDRRLARRAKAAGMSGILVYALHHDGAVQQELARRRLRGRAAGGRARHGVPRARAGRPGRPARTSCAPRSAATARRRCSASRAPRASRSRWSTRWRRSSARAGTSYALFGGGLLGFEIGAGLERAARRRRVHGGRRTSRGARTGRARRRAARSCRTRRSPTCTTRRRVGVIIGRLNAFETPRVRRRRGRRRGRRGRVRAALPAGARWSRAASSAAPT